MHEPVSSLKQFQAHDQSHPQSSQIYAKLDHIAEELLARGHVFDPNLITRQLSPDETYQSALCGHSEKLAIAFNLLQEPSPSIIYVTKNLRMCDDCREYLATSCFYLHRDFSSLLDRVTKLIALLYQCQIIVRDANRVHHFSPNGQCSCLDYFWNKK